MWLTPVKGTPVAYESDLANESPTRREPTSPGPCVTAMPPMSPRVAPALSIASLTTGIIDSMCLREASSGTMPPYFACMSSCEETTEESTFLPSSTTAAAVSSHELSIPNTSIPLTLK